ncbi:MAG: hypothetical protein M1816_006126 [Peltula sp. TS41687]|nr:MAG: hypothetical protein M1816_006126 [Peltula sp. TS41687]
MNPDLLQQINPLVPTSIQHNTKYHTNTHPPPFGTHAPKVLSHLRNLTSSLFGIAAGILGLEAWVGFLFYVVGTTVVSALVWALLAGGRPGVYFGSLTTTQGNNEGEEEGEKGSGSGGGWRLWTEEVLGGLSSFVLTWTLFYGLVRA